MAKNRPAETPSRSIRFEAARLQANPVAGVTEEGGVL